MTLEEDRRKILRKDLRVKVILRESDRHLVKGESVNISVAGMLFESTEKIKSGQDVQVHFFLPVPGDLLVCVGNVRWILPLRGSYYTGISFTALGREELFALNSLGI